jgi:hypothetical protein
VSSLCIEIEGPDTPPRTDDSKRAGLMSDCVIELSTHILESGDYPKRKSREVLCTYTVRALVPLLHALHHPQTTLSIQSSTSTTSLHTRHDRKREHRATQGSMGPQRHFSRPSSAPPTPHNLLRAWNRCARLLMSPLFPVMDLAVLGTVPLGPAPCAPEQAQRSHGHVTKYSRKNLQHRRRMQLCSPLRRKLPTPTARVA